MAYLNIDTDGDICNDFEVIDLNTGKNYNRCKWANDETGEYLERRIENGEIIDELKKANIKLVYSPVEERE